MPEEKCRIAQFIAKIEGVAMGARTFVFVKDFRFFSSSEKPMLHNTLDKFRAFRYFVPGSATTKLSYTDANWEANKNVTKILMRLPRIRWGREDTFFYSGEAVCARRCEYVWCAAVVATSVSWTYCDYKHVISLFGVRHWAVELCAVDDWVLGGYRYTLFKLVLVCVFYVVLQIYRSSFEL